MPVLLPIPPTPILGVTTEIALAMAVIAVVVLVLWRQIQHRRRLEVALKHAEQLGIKTAQLGQRLGDVSRQRDQLNAVLSSMVEGVIGIGPDERVLWMNDAAGRMLGMTPNQTIGRAFEEIVRAAPLQALIRQTLAAQTELSEEILIHQPLTTGLTVSQRQQHLQVQTAILHQKVAGAYDAIQAEASDTVQEGALVVLHDITAQRRLENVRREFVANVSHEVRTPVAAIKGAVETLQEEPDFAEDPEQRARFLDIIARQASRMAAIVDDLLQLARIEQDEATLFDDLVPTLLCPVLSAAVDNCRPAADARQIEITIDVESDLAALIQERLIEQAVVNLLDNAIRFSEDRQSIQIMARRIESEGSNPTHLHTAADHDTTRTTDSTSSSRVRIDVIDHGAGISERHLPRLFERFYRTDKDRRRGRNGAGNTGTGGTGLGLAIVKHIAEAHGGRATVTSVPGEGSRFSIELRSAAPPDSIPLDPASQVEQEHA